MSQQKHLRVGAYLDQYARVRHAISYSINLPKGWLWSRKIIRKQSPTWGAWEACWTHLHNTHAAQIPVHQGIQLLQHHGPLHLRRSWGWVFSLLSQGVPFGDAVDAVFHIPRGWHPLLCGATVSSAFLGAIALFCQKRKRYQDRIKSYLRYPIVMSILISVMALLSEWVMDFDTQWYCGVTYHLGWWQTLIPYGICVIVWGAMFAMMWMWHTQSHNVSLFRFLELALKAGYTEYEALQHYDEKTSDCRLIRKNLALGVSFEQSVTGIWPKDIVDMLKIHQGKLACIITIIANMVEHNEAAALGRWLVWTQAILVIMMGVMVLWMAWSKLLPLYQNMDVLISR